MEIKIRNLDPVIVKKFDEMAKKSSISRDKLLCSILTKIAVTPEVDEREKRYEQLIVKNIEMMELMSLEVGHLRNIITELMEE
ncbi:hypothetical protein COJ46_22180 [Bacillus sp. AFS077874]|uniref:hypothetical protein n=1 Tax=unclassified Bacillus (in: firmicutes) TaxID=185979 RepID=UPI0008DF3AEF|nr:MULTISPECIES: hypothetical protein [unclassified Bacillus (in: firmicutes)]PEJ57964.1 hypothetical protein CN692_10750 [Bacillus sp. AFS002410]PFM75261.1 hypothetical protein COJ46_22180 [Bacillus sp. AFS077874]QKE76044.1 hypothetical protein HPK19_24870 [Arthrobacter citreus]SFD59825.1 hypothetical protein SAMN02799633_04221 [Bacillus sp. UNCCL81]